ncbi:MAG: DNA polymerase beta superfamily protein [Puniceicoccaceae bacterium]
MSHHPLNLSAGTQWNLFSEESPRRLKPHLYVYRVLLTGIHLMRTGRVEANLKILNEDYRSQLVSDLMAQKLAQPEKGGLDNSNISYHEQEYLRLRAELESASQSSILREAPEEITRASLNKLLIELRSSPFRA